MNQRTKLSSLIGIILLGVVPYSANATNGLWLPGFGAKSIGMGGATIALQQDSLAQAVNPAGISGMEQRFDIGAGIFHAPRRAFVDAEGDPTFGSSIAEDTSARSAFLIPNLAYATPLNDDMTFGFAMVGAGLGTDYSGIYDFTTNDGIEIVLVQLQIPITLAYEVSETFSVAASITPAFQMFEANGFTDFAPVTSDLENYTDNGKDFSYGAGARIGFLGSNSRGTFTYGGFYHSRVYMTEFDDYSGLFAEQGDLDIPANYGLGFSYKPVNKLTIAFDVTRIEWSSVAAMGNKGPELFTGDPLGTAALGGVGALGRDDGMGFGWVDQTVYKLGFLYQYATDLSFSIGFNYGESPIPQDQLAFAIIGPAVTERHIGLGIQKKLKGYTMFGAEEAELSISYLHAFKEKMAGTIAVGQDDFANNNAGFGEAEMVQNQIEISYGLKF